VRKLIAAMKMSLDAKFEGPEGYAGWVAAWSEDYGLMPQIDACLLGAGMYLGYENYWTSIQNEPNKPVWITGSPPTAAEIEWAGFAKKIPHYVLSSRLQTAHWPKTRFLRGLDDIAALKQHKGKDIYLMGGGRITASLIEAGLVDELRLIVYPIIAGGGKALFSPGRSHTLELHETEPLQRGLVRLTYRMTHSTGRP
jgi:dihydrofolate reductase